MRIFPVTDWPFLLLNRGSVRALLSKVNEFGQGTQQAAGERTLRV